MADRDGNIALLLDAPIQNARHEIELQRAAASHASGSRPG